MNGIKRLRQELCLTQEKFAEYLGVTQQAVAAWESGHAKPAWFTIFARMIKLGRTVNMTHQDILRGVSHEKD